ncbi:helix-turn-helix transcriptional regulator [Microbacterium thalassium]|uniref:DNA-binding CsgD family transcriptional regulator n=1 Tax=Microbacterium thalassium TaxID=362649 RepID=A0A7X0KUH1_9MICO|nr:LuxR family transcriptional regulator [Microbacterium thalassium]MBB6391171.1 DNA-binding CsgD family transcriptional regulator [Microbacterium thalassium]
MVGRDADLAVLAAAFADSRDGRTRTALVRGDAGIGKTRLLREFLGGVPRGADDGALPVVVAVGRCVDLGPIGTPFTPVRRLLREIRAAVGDDRLRSAAGSPTVLATLATLVPDLESDALPPPRGGDYVVEAVERVIEDLSVDHHLLLIMEDIHWADAATTALLRTLATTLQAEHVTIALTYRTDDIGDDHPLRPFVTELERSRSVDVIDLAPLGPDEIREQIEHLGADRLGPNEIDAVVARSAGIPFFVEELVQLSSGALPPTLRDVVLASADACDPPTRRMLDALSVAVDRADSALLAEVTGADESAVLEGLRPAVTRGIVVPVDDAFQFRHALIAEALRDRLLAPERTGLHRAYARALERRADSGRTGLFSAISEHLLAAGEEAAAFEATRRARREAMSASAPVIVGRLTERLLELWDRVPDAAEQVGMSRAAVALELIDALTSSADPRAIDVADDALARLDDDDVMRARLLHAQARAYANLDEPQHAIECDREALALLDGATEPEPLVLRAGVVACIAYEDDERPVPERRAELEWAVAVAEEHAQGDALELVHNRMSAFLTITGDRRGALEHSRKALEAASSLSRRFVATLNYLADLGDNGMLTESIELAEQTLAYCREVGWERGIPAYFALDLLMSLMPLGRYDEARALAHRCMRLFAGQPTMQSWVARCIILLHAMNDEVDIAEDAWDEYAHLRPDPHADPKLISNWVITEVQLRMAEWTHAATPDARAEALRAALTAAAGYASASREDLPCPDLFLPWLALLVTTARSTGLDDENVAVVDGVVQHGVATITDDILGQGNRAVTEAELGATMSDPSSSRAAWERAVAALDPAVHDVWVHHLAAYRLAGAELRCGAREQAADRLDRVATAASRDGIGLVARWARTLTHDAGLAHGDDAPVPAPAAPSLTPRELQVLALVAEGLTNAQIGERLYIAPKTASVHVSAILAKLGAANRAEAAAVYTAGAFPPGDLSDAGGQPAG